MKLHISYLLLPLWIGITSAQPVTTVTTVTLDATQAVTLDGSEIATNSNGYTGNGFIDFGGVGTSASWLVDIPIEGFYEVTIRYASRADRGPMDLLIDEAKVGSFVIKKVANNWDTWKDETINVRIDAGSNRKLKLLASVKKGPNVDRMTIKQVETPIPPDEPVQDDVYRVILQENECLDRGVFEESESGIFDVGFDPSGYLVLRRKASSEVLWSLKVSEEDTPSKVCLKNDGSLVVRPISGGEPNCDDNTTGVIYERNFGFRFGINNSGAIAVFLDEPTNLIWTGGLGTSVQPATEPTTEPTTEPATEPTTQPAIEPTPKPIPAPTFAPTTQLPIPFPTFAPTNKPTLAPTNKPTLAPTSSSSFQYTKVLSENNYFGRARGNFGQSDSGEFEVGLNGNGNFVVRRSANSFDVVWTLKDANGIDVVGDKLYMQNDGNLVMRNKDRKAVWTSKTANGRKGYSIGINNCGGIAAFHSPSSTGVVWTGGIPGGCGDTMPQEPPSLVPVRAPTKRPTLSPAATPKPSFDSNRPTSKPYSVVLASNDRVLERGRFVYSPNGLYNVGLSSNGQLIIRKGPNNEKVWTLMDKHGEEISNVSRMYMQSDGNLVLKTSSNKGLWSSETSKNNGSEFFIDDGGQLSIDFQGTSLWIDGIPRNVYTGPSSSDLSFPLRGFFYYAWYPETWSVGGERVFYTPNLLGIEGHYRSGDPAVVKNHVKALDYGWADICIVSWWGPSDRLDRARITQLLDETSAQGSSIKWTVYYEDEKKFDRTVDELVADLDYLKKWFAWHESWAHMDGKPVIFIWNESECEVADRWVKAANKAGWYVVLKLFGKYDECDSQPDSWHQYGVSDNYLQYQVSFTIGPGFFKANADKPDHPRVPRTKFCGWVDEMIRSNRDWQLIVSFNEWGEGTAVESAVEWESRSGYGIYLDCLHDPILYGA